MPDSYGCKYSVLFYGHEYFVYPMCSRCYLLSEGRLPVQVVYDTVHTFWWLRLFTAYDIPSNEKTQ